MFRRLFRAWMMFSAVLGEIVTGVMATAFFFVIITPVGFAFRRMGRDPLRLAKKNRPRDSYWVPHPEMKDKTSYEHLF